MTTSLAKKEQQQLAVIPAHLKGLVGSREGKENVGQEDLLIPRLVVCQALSPQLKKNNEAYIPGLQAGQIFNSVTGEIYGDTVRIIPLFFFHQYFHFKPIEEGGGIIAVYKTAEDVPAGGLEWKDGNAPQVTEFKSRMALVQSENGLQPIVLSFKSTGMKFAKKLNSFIAMFNLPSYSRWYRLDSVTQTKGQQEWFGMNPALGEFVEEALLGRIQQYFQELQGAGIRVDTSGLDESGDTDFQGQTIDGQM